MVGEEISHYIIVDKLGSGGMGEVYLAMDKLLNRLVAIKVLSRRMTPDSEAHRHLQREARSAASLDHPNICTVHEVGEHGGYGYIAMQYVDGETLATVIKREPVPARHALLVACQLADALAAAHAVGIIHRDIKPQNIMLTPKGQLKVLDFGLATRLTNVALLANAPARTAARTLPEVAAKNGAPVAVDCEATVSLASGADSLAGTIPYMSPEQVKGEALDLRTDIFSFGSVIYEMLTGRALFAREDASRTMQAILTKQPPPLPVPQERVTWFEEFQAVIQKCMEKNRNDRYESGAELAATLNNLRRRAEAGDAGEATRAKRSRVPSAVTWVVGICLLLVIAAVPATLEWGGKKPPLSADAAKPALESIAVLPLRVVGEGPADDYLGDGLTVSLINQLSQVANLKVIARNTAFRYKGQEVEPRAVGQQLNVAAVLTGSIERRGEGLVVSLLLSETGGNNRLWEKRFTSKSQDLLELQSDILREVSEELRPQSSGDLQKRFQKRTTQNLEAYELYLKGIYHLNRRTPASTETALASFQEAVGKDPNYALAYSGMADAYTLLDDFNIQPPKLAMPLAERSANQALALDPSLGEAHSTLAVINKDFKMDWPATERELNQALELNPNYASTYSRYGWYLISMGRFEEALMYMRKAQELDPRSLNMNTAVGLPYYFSRRYDKAVDEYQRTLQLDPEFYPANFYLALSYIEMGRQKEAVKIYQKLRKVNDGPDPLVYLGYAYAKAGQKREAREMLAALKRMATRRYVPPYDLAQIYAQLGEKDQAMFWLQKAYDERELSYLIKVEPILDPLRSDPRFQALLQRLKLAD